MASQLVFFFGRSGSNPVAVDVAPTPQLTYVGVFLGSCYPRLQTYLRPEFRNASAQGALKK